MKYLIYALLFVPVSLRAAPLIQPQDISPSTYSIMGLSVGTTTVPTERLTVYGIVVSSTPSAVSVSCTAGSPALLANANNQSGQFTAGTLATACTVTWAQAWKTIPSFCSCGTGTTLYADATWTKTTITCTAATALTGDTINYFCWGVP